jgi:hypothetical protein
VTYHLNIYHDLIGVLSQHTEPAPPARSIGWVPENDYTGVVIYAAEPLDHFDTGTRTLLEPTLFPGIYYREEDGSELYRLMESVNVLPEYLERWGAIGYTTDPYATSWHERVGNNPLRIMAIGVFGSYPTDPIIRKDEALQLLSTDRNRALLREGRVVIIYLPRE